jgi:hypothetical protein
MPNPKICNKIADPAARRRCLNYEGEFAQAGAPEGTAGPRPATSPVARGRFAPRGNPGVGGWGGGNRARRRRPGPDDRRY